MKFIFPVIIFAFLAISCLGQTNKNIDIQKPLKLNLNIKQQESCIGKDFKIIARLINISKKSVTIDNRNLWRYVQFKAIDSVEESKSENSVEEETSAMPSKLPSFSDLLRLNRYQITMGDNFEDDEVPKKFLVTINPGKSYKDFISIKSNDSFFQKSGKYFVKSAYRQYSDWSSENVFLFIGNVESNELEFELANCK